MTNQRKRNNFLYYVGLIKELGYNVWSRKDESATYGWVVNNNNEVGYFQLDAWGFGVQFSTCHKPNTEFGCGFGLDSRFEGHEVITKGIIDRCFMHHPSWATGNLGSIEKWKADEFIENEKIKCFKDIIKL